MVSLPTEIRPAETVCCVCSLHLLCTRLGFWWYLCLWWFRLPLNCLSLHNSGSSLGPSRDHFPSLFISLGWCWLVAVARVWQLLQHFCFLMIQLSLPISSMNLLYLHLSHECLNYSTWAWFFIIVICVHILCLLYSALGHESCLFHPWVLVPTRLPAILIGDQYMLVICINKLIWHLLLQCTPFAPRLS